LYDQVTVPFRKLPTEQKSGNVYAFNAPEGFKKRISWPKLGKPLREQITDIEKIYNSEYHVNIARNEIYLFYKGA
jgi:hypothetical protein